MILSKILSVMLIPAGLIAPMGAQTQGFLGLRAVPVKDAAPAFPVADRPLQGILILDAGAKCDGVTDDSAAVQRAFNSAKIVTVPTAGNYCIINSTVTIPTGATLKADASGINFNGAANCFKSATLAGDMFGLAGGDNTIDGVCFEHDGPRGRIITDVGKLGHNRIRNSGFSATNAANPDHLVYFDSSDNGVENSLCSNGRPAASHAFCLAFDATGGTINIANYANRNMFSAPNFPGAGPAVYVGSSDASARNESFHFGGNYIISQADNNLLIGALLDGEFVGNTFDQGYNSQVVLASNSKFAVDQISFVGNWFSTPVQQATGICIGQDATASFPVGNITFTGNHFAFCGYGAVFHAPADKIAFVGNEFADIRGAATSVSEVTNVSWLGNQYSFIHGANLRIADGKAGGPFIISGEQYDPRGAIEIVETTPARFTFGPTTGKLLAGAVSATEHITSCKAQEFKIPHGLAGTPQIGRTSVSIALPASGAAKLSAPTAYIAGVGPADVTVAFQCGALANPGDVALNVSASL
ncbi:MAG: hypothetical protein ACLQNV_07365 [Steroidobacteraceae bacterium]